MSITANRSIKIMKKKLGVIVFLLITTGLIILAWGQKVNLVNNLKQKESMETENKGSLENQEPCRFDTREGSESANQISVKQRQDRKIYGYEAEIPLSEAVNIFNEELKCSPLYKMFPPLSEEEVIGAIVGGADFGGQNDTRVAQSETLWKVAVERKLPKSSLLSFSGKSRTIDSPLSPNGIIDSNGIRITLILGIDDKNGLHETLNSDQIFIIRKSFSGFEEVK